MHAQKIFPLFILALLIGCSETEPEIVPPEPLWPVPKPTPISGTAIIAQFNGRIDPNNLDNYANQPKPNYITKDNGKDNPITNVGAMLGRVLFYDKQLSIDNTVSCSSCHHQKLAFGDTALVGTGVSGGKTMRHTMRLVNARFSVEAKFFWDERAATLEDQTIMPIKDHGELGFSGEQGRPDIDDLIAKLSSIDYYQELFTMTYGEPAITEKKMQAALAQFVRSIQSFDSKYDEGYASNFSNFTESELRGKDLFSTEVIRTSNNRSGGGLSCFRCHQAPEFDIRHDTGNNGVIGVANDPNGIDIENTKAPSLRNITNPSGELNGPLMHDGSVKTFEDLIERVGTVIKIPENPNLDELFGNGGQLLITEQETEDLVAFLKTLTGKDVYTNEKWSDPFEN